MLVIILSCKYVDENIIIKFKMNSLWKDHSSKILWFVVSSFSIDKWRVSFLLWWASLIGVQILDGLVFQIRKSNGVTPLKVVTTMHTLVVTTFQTSHYYTNKVFLLDFSSKNIQNDKHKKTTLLIWTSWFGPTMVIGWSFDWPKLKSFLFSSIILKYFLNR